MPGDSLGEIARLWSKLQLLTPLLPAVLAVAGLLHWHRTRQGYLFLLTLGAGLTFGGWSAEPVLRQLNAANSPHFDNLLCLSVFLSGFGLIFGLVGGVMAILAHFKMRRAGGRWGEN